MNILKSVFYGQARFQEGWGGGGGVVYEENVICC